MDIARYKNDIVNFLENEYYVPDTGKLINFAQWQWQRDILKTIFETKEDGKRRYTAGIISSPRQQGKSLVLQAIGLYMLIAGGTNLNIYSLACDLSQASLVPARVQKAIRLNPRLTASVLMKQNKIECPANGNVWHIMSSDEPGATGIISDVLLWDELGQLPEYSNLFHLVTPAMSARREPLMIVASTVGESESGPLFSLMELARQGKDEHVYLYHTSELKSPLTNLDQVDRARLMMPVAVFARHFENRIISDESFLIDADIAGMIIPEDLIPGYENPRFIGVDYGVTGDKFAVVSVANCNGTYVIDEIYTFQGTKANPVDLNSALDKIRELYHSCAYGRLIFDKWQSMAHLQQLQSEGIHAEGYDFSAAKRQQLFKNLFSCIRNGRLKVYNKQLATCWKHECKSCPDKCMGEQTMNLNLFLRELRGLHCDSSWRVTHGKVGDDITIATAMALVQLVEGVQSMEVRSSRGVFGHSQEFKDAMTEAERIAVTEEKFGRHDMPRWWIKDLGDMTFYFWVDVAGRVDYGLANKQTERRMYADLYG